MRILGDIKLLKGGIFPVNSNSESYYPVYVAEK